MYTEYAKDFIIAVVMLQTRALYNLLRLNGEREVEDLRPVATDELFSRLQRYGIQIEQAAFTQFAEECQSPEELTELLLPDEGEEEDAVYLILFELWRRILPEKPSLSIFCDELDHRIALYDQGVEESDELIQEALVNLLEVLDQNVDAGADPQEVFSAISDYCAHDLETFLFDYILDLLDSENCLSASELIEGYSHYIQEPLWFDFLRARLLSFTDEKAAQIAIQRILESNPDEDLMQEIARVLG
jgi:hypothetical protein